MKFPQAALLVFLLPGLTTLHAQKQPAAVPVTVVCEVHEVPRSQVESHKEATTGLGAPQRLLAITTKTGMRALAKDESAAFEVEPHLGESGTLELGVKLDIDQQPLKALLNAEKGNRVFVGASEIAGKETARVAFVRWSSPLPEIPSQPSKSDRDLVFVCEVYRVSLKDAADLLEPSADNAPRGSINARAAILASEGRAVSSKLPEFTVKNGHRHDVNGPEMIVQMEPMLLEPENTLVDVNIRVQKGKRELVTSTAAKIGEPCFLGTLETGEADSVELVFLTGKTGP